MRVASKLASELAQKALRLAAAEGILAMRSKSWPFVHLGHIQRCTRRPFCFRLARVKSMASTCGSWFLSDPDPLNNHVSVCFLLYLEFLFFGSTANGKLVFAEVKTELEPLFLVQKTRSRRLASATCSADTMHSESKLGNAR